MKKWIKTIWHRKRIAEMRERVQVGTILKDGGGNLYTVATAGKLWAEVEPQEKQGGIYLFFGRNRLEWLIVATRYEIVRSASDEVEEALNRR